MADADQSNLTSLTVDLLSAYVANNSVEHVALADLIKSTHAALKVIDSPEPPAPEEPEYKPAVSVRQSLKSDSHIISLIDGKPYQTLKRHLKRHDLTPDEYRARYGLPKSYPMVAPAYSAARREIAKKLGLGNRVKGAQADATPAPAAKVEPAATKPVPASTKARKTPAAKVVKAAPAEADATPAPKSKASPKSKAPAKAKGAAVPVKPKTTVASVASETPVASTPAKAAPKARKAPAPKPAAAPATTPAKSPARKRTPKAAEPAG